MDPDQLAGYYIGYAVLAALWVKPLGILWLISLCLARRRDDPARAGIAWMKAITPFWSLACTVYTVWAGLQIWFQLGGASSFSFTITFTQISAHLMSTAVFLQAISDVILFITLVELGSGFLLCMNGGQPPSSRKVARSLILGWGFVLLVLAIARFGMTQSTAVDVGKPETWGWSRVVTVPLSDVQMTSAFMILMWLTSLVLIGFASMVTHKTKTNPMLRNSAVLLLVATILNYLRHQVTMAIYIHESLVPYLNPRPSYKRNPANDLVVEPLFNFVPMFVLLVLLFTIGVRKQKGLWSKPQPGWSLTAAFNTTSAPVAPAGHVPPPMAHAPAVVQPVAPTPGMPAYLAVAQQMQMQQQQQQQQQYPHQHLQQAPPPGWPQGQQMQPMYAQPVPPPQGGYYYYPQQPVPNAQPQPQ